MRLPGSNQALAWCSEQPNEMWIGHRDKPNESLIRDPALLGDKARRFTNYPGGHNEGFPDTFKQCFRAFYDYIKAGDFAAPAIVPHVCRRPPRDSAVRGHPPEPPRGPLGACEKGGRQ